MQIAILNKYVHPNKLLDFLQIFKYGPAELGYGPCKSAWSPDSNLIAVCGDNKIIRIMDR